MLEHRQFSIATIAQATWRAYRTKGWLKPFRNATPLLAGRAGQGVLSLVAVALATRTLGAELFGILVLITAFRQLVTGLTKLRARDTIVRFGALALQAGDLARLRAVLRFGIAVDGCSAVVALTAIIFFADLFVEAMDLPSAYLNLARLFGLSAAFALLANTPDGLLRLFDRYDLIAIQSVLTPAVQVLGSVVLYMLEAPLTAFVAVWFLATAISRSWIIAAGVREYRKQRIGPIGRPRWADVRRPEPGVWHFTTATYLIDALGEAKRHGAVMLIGAMLDPAAAAILRIATQIGTLPSRPLSKVLTPALFPELARLTAEKARRKRRKMATNSGLLAAAFAAAVAIVLVVFGQTLVTAIFGAGFAPAYWPMLTFAGHGVLEMLLHPIRPLLASAGRVYLPLLGRVVNFSAWGLMFYFLVPIHGPTGAALAEFLGFLAANVVVLMLSARYLLRQHDHKTL